MLGLGIASMLLQLASIVVALGLGLLTRCRWLPKKHGRLSVGLLNCVVLSQVLFGLWVAYPAALKISLLIGLITLSPLVVANIWVFNRRSSLQ